MAMRPHTKRVRDHMSQREKSDVQQSRQEREMEEATAFYNVELDKAAERFHRIEPKNASASEKAMLWVLRFACEDLEKLSEGQWSDLRFEIDYFTRIGPFETRQLPATAEGWPGSPDPNE